MRTKSNTSRTLTGAILLTAIIGGLTACSSLPPQPNTAMIQAQSAVAQAQNADTRQYAAMDLNNAVMKLQAANDANAKRDYKQANDLAEEAQVDAQLAMAKTQAAKAQEAEAQVRKGNEALQDQVQQPIH